MILHDLMKEQSEILCSWIVFVFSKLFSLSIRHRLLFAIILDKNCRLLNRNDSLGASSFFKRCKMREDEPLSSESTDVQKHRRPRYMIFAKSQRISLTWMQLQLQCTVENAGIATILLGAFETTNCLI